MDEQVGVAVISALVSFSSAVVAGLSLIYNRDHKIKQMITGIERLTTLKTSNQIWMSGGYMHFIARTLPPQTVQVLLTAI